MPFLIDGNNLMYAVRKAGLEVGRSGLCRLLGALGGRERIRVVFDGPAPRAGGAGEPADAGMEVTYSAPRSADEMILDDIAADSAPRRLTVVSTDRRIRKAARRRRCRGATSEEFAGRLLARLERPAPKAPIEPPEKRHGLTPEQTRQWLRELQLDEPDGS